MHQASKSINRNIQKLFHSIVNMEVAGKMIPNGSTSQDGIRRGWAPASRKAGFASCEPLLLEGLKQMISKNRSIFGYHLFTHPRFHP